MNSRLEAVSPTDGLEVWVGVELGGTKMVIASSTDGRSIAERRQLPTADPDSTLRAIREAIAEIAAGRGIRGLGVASFGPLDLRKTSHRFGQLIDTPKPGWSGVDIIRTIAPSPDVPFLVDTDVNAAVMAEARYGAGIGFDHVAYLTVGTGVGGGVYSNGGVVRGSNHSEIGHIRVPRHPEDHHLSSCPFHGDCLEGMASGTAVRERWGQSAEDLGELQPAALRLEAWYLARGIAGLCAVIPVDLVVIGGGLAKLPGLHDEVARSLGEASGLYPPIPFAENGPRVVAPVLGDDAGVRGAIELAKLATSGSAGTQGSPSRR